MSHKSRFTKIPYIFIVLFTYLGPAPLLSQYTGFNYIDPVFTEVEPDWVYVSYEEEMVNLMTEDTLCVYDGYNHFRGFNDKSIEPLIHEGYFYRVSSTIYNNDIAGIIIEKIDLNTGELIWQNGYDPRDADHDYKEHIMLAEIEGNSLRLYNLKLLPSPYYSIFGNGYGNLIHRRFDLETGEQIEFIPPDTTLSNLASIRSGEGYGVLFDPSKEEDLIEIYTLTHVDTTFLESHLTIDSINNRGQRLNPLDTLTSKFAAIVDPLGYLVSVRSGMAKDKNGTLYWLQNYINRYFPSKTKYAEIVKIENGHIIDTLSLDNLTISDTRSVSLESINDTTILLNSEIIDFSPSRFQEISSIDGSLLSEYTISDCFFSRDTRQYVDYMNEDFIIGASCFEGDVTSTMIYQKENDNLVPIKELRLKNPIYDLSFDEIFKVSESDYIVKFGYNERLSRISFKGAFSGTMKISAEELGIGTSATAETPVTDKVSLFPNPCSEYLTLSFTSNDKYDIRIVDLLGHTLITDRDIQSKTHEIEVAHLPAGHYYVSIVSGGNLQSYPLVIVR